MAAQILSPEEIARELNNPNSPLFKAREYAIQCAFNSQVANAAQQRMLQNSPDRSFRKSVKVTLNLDPIESHNQPKKDNAPGLDQLEQKLHASNIGIAALELKMLLNTQQAAKDIFEKINPGQIPSPQQLQAITHNLNILTSTAHPVTKINASLKIATAVSRPLLSAAETSNGVSYEPNLKPSEIRKMRPEIDAFLRRDKEDVLALKVLIKENATLQSDYQNKVGTKFKETPENLLAEAIRKNDFSPFGITPKPGSSNTKNDDNEKNDMSHKYKG